MTIWILGLCVVLLFLGGISLDLWRAFSDRRTLAAIVDAAAIAGASDLDQDAVRARSPEGDLVARLDQDAARRRAEDLLTINATKLRIQDASVTFSPDLTEITVTASALSKLTLVHILLPGEPPLTLTVTSTVKAQESG